MGRVSNHAKMKMHLANVVLGDEKQSTPCIMAVNCFFIILYDAMPVIVHNPKIELRFRIPLISR